MKSFEDLISFLGALAGVGTLIHAAQEGKWRNEHTAMAALSVAAFVAPRLPRK